MVIAVDTPTEFAWDADKDASNRAKHGISFERAVAVFLDQNHIVHDATQPGQGEQRSKAIGAIEGRLYTIVFTMRGSVCRCISARRPNARERKRYDNRPQDTRRTEG